LKNPSQFKTGNPFTPFVVENENLVTARFPGDVELYVKTLIEKVGKR
jgi:hypothetical protein